MSRTRTFVAEQGGDRLDKFLDERCSDLSRSRLQRLISEGMGLFESKGMRPHCAHTEAAATSIPSVSKVC